MKKLSLIGTSVLILLLAVSCISTPKQTLPQTPPPSPAVTPPPATTPTPSPLPTSPPESTSMPTPTPTPAPSPSLTPVPPKEGEELKVHFIDVGQGDAILIDLKDIEVLIDGGERSSGVVPYLKTYVDGPLEVMIATHPHADHIGGLIAVLDFFEIEEIWLNGDNTTTKTYEEFMSRVSAEGALINKALRGQSIEVDSLTLDILNPWIPQFSDVNNNSIVLLLSYGEIDFLFMGDAEQEAESNILRAGILLDVEILKVGHHGSNSSSSPEFLHTVKPETTIYMAGEGITYGHPHEETIAALTEVGAAIYGTDVHGTIVVTTDGEKYDIGLEKPSAPRVSPTISSTPAEFTVTNLVISPIEVEIEETVTISAIVTNSGGSAGTHTVVLKVDNARNGTKSVTLDAGESQKISFAVTRHQSSNYIVDINGLEGTFTVVGAVIEDLAYIQIMVLGYTDDADPEPDGISLYITFYDSKSEHIVSQISIPVTVTIEIYSDKNRELVYEEQSIKNIPKTYSELSTLMGHIVMKIPFEAIQNNNDRIIIEVAVTIPQQGDFRDTTSYWRR